MRFFLAAIIAILVIPGAPAQENSIDSLASQMAKAISKSKQKTVIVFDFVGPDQKLNALGQKLADEFSGALEKSGAKFGVVDRLSIREELKKNYASLDAAQDFNTAWNIAQVLGTQAFITGKLSIKGNSLQVTLNCSRSGDGKGIKQLQVVVSLTQELNALLVRPAEEKQKTTALTLGSPVEEKDETPPPTGPPALPTDGYSAPACLHCPPAQFSGAAIKAKMSGTVTLMGEIGVDGRMHHIRILKALPYGLTEQAIKAVQGWTLKPSTGPDGNPAAVRQIIEVTFHRY